ncbi:hypothetical protein [Dyella lutea]|uniref:Uncharacterized protein n=1 Tax=Dyella lutea TaxID=2950441 RepID=A0ABT1FCX6_9GAMM|nr:hypothetical protein [Dyella lutea]MCP1375232.1 hypothetical protein [Dyella lutea]
MRIELRIERLALDQPLLGGELAADVRAALERELGRILGGPGATDALRRIGCVDAITAPSISDGGRAQGGLGTRIAGAVGQGLGIGSREIRPAQTGDRIDGRQR